MDKIQILKFTSSTCVPCKALSLTLASLGTLPVDIVEVRIDTEDGAASSSKYNVRSVPTLIAIDQGGNTLNRVTGNIQKQKLVSWLLSVGVKV